MVLEPYLHVTPSCPLSGTVEVLGAKNAVLVIMASLLLTRGTSYVRNVPYSTDMCLMMTLSQILFDKQEHLLTVDTTHVDAWHVSSDIMRKMRASILVLGPLLVRFGKAQLSQPGGCKIGLRPIDYHLYNFKKMGANIIDEGDYLHISTTQLHAQRLVLEYPSVGATENIIMAAVLTAGTTTIINAALEPEVLDLIGALNKMGAYITVLPAACIEITGVEKLHPIDYTIISDRLEAGALLLAGAITQGDLWIPSICSSLLDVFLFKLEHMGHIISTGPNKKGIRIQGTALPHAVSFKTGPYPNFPTDLQSPMMAAQLPACGISIVEETVFENRLQHIHELKKMGADITQQYNKAIVKGGNQLVGTLVNATDIRSSCALVLAGLVAQGSTIITGVHHWQRGYEALEQKLTQLGAHIVLKNEDDITHSVSSGIITAEILSS